MQYVFDKQTIAIAYLFFLFLFSSRVIELFSIQRLGVVFN